MVNKSNNCYYLPELTENRIQKGERCKSQCDEQFVWIYIAVFSLQSENSDQSKIKVAFFHDWILSG